MAIFTMTDKLIIGTRTSPLALWQTGHVIEQLQQVWPGLLCEIRSFTTQGDKTQAQGKPLPEIGGKGLFTAELEEALLAGEIDLAVHSLKDLPVENPAGVTLGAICSRADVRDVLVTRAGWTLATLPLGATVGTSSTRRAAQLLAARPDLTLKPIRGNVATRVQKVQNGDYDATVLAGAGVQRLGMDAAISEWLPLSTMLPAPGQGALAVQCRAADDQVLRWLAAIDDTVVRAAVTAERDFLHGLGGGCSAPVAAFAQPTANGHFQLAALVATPDGQQLVRMAGTGEPATLGQQLAQQALAQGADRLLTHAPSLSSPNVRSPLQGKRIVITRPRAQAGELADKLAQLGATPLLLPLIKIVPLPDLRPLQQAIAQLPSYHWLIFTSSNTVDLFGQQLQLSQQPADLWQNLRVATVGPATALALQPYAIAASFVPTAHVAEALVEGLGDLTGKRVLLPQAAIARPTLAALLTERGAQVDAIPIYQTQPVAWGETELAEVRRGVDVILLTSGSTARSLVTLAARDETVQQQLQQSLIACIGPQTAQVAAEVGLPVGLVAEEYTTAGLVQALSKYFGS